MVVKLGGGGGGGCKEHNKLWSCSDVINFLGKDHQVYILHHPEIEEMLDFEPET